MTGELTNLPEPFNMRDGGVKWGPCRETSQGVSMHACVIKSRTYAPVGASHSSGAVLPHTFSLL